MTVTLVIQLPSLRCNPGCLTSLYMDTVHWSRLKSGNCHSYQQPSKCKVKNQREENSCLERHKGQCCCLVSVPLVRFMRCSLAVFAFKDEQTLSAIKLTITLIRLQLKVAL